MKKYILITLLCLLTLPSFAQGKLIESSEEEHQWDAARYHASFINKNSKKIDLDLQHALKEHFGFGDFIIRDPETGKEILRIKDLKD